MKSLIVLFTVIIAAQVNGGVYHKANGTNYWLSTPLVANYHEAYRHCALNGMYLVSIHTQINHNALMEAINIFKTTISEKAHIWTSGTNLGYPALEFYWAETGYPISFSNWNRNQARSNENGRCILLIGSDTRQYLWEDLPCLHVHHFICEDRIQLPNVKGTGCGEDNKKLTLKRLKNV